MVAARCFGRHESGENESQFGGGKGTLNHEDNTLFSRRYAVVAADVASSDAAKSRPIIFSNYSTGYV